MKYFTLVVFAVLALWGLSYLSSTDSVEFPDRIAVANIFSLPKIPKNYQTIDIAFVGDAMFDRHIRSLANKESYDFLLKEIKSTLNAFDAVVVNLEGPVTSYSTKATYNQSDPNHYVFTFDPSVLETLYDSNIRIANLDNNHILNFGSTGLEQTKNYLNEADIEYFGDPYVRKPLIKTINNTRIGFISFNQFLSPDPEETVRSIEETVSLTDFIVIYTHWGTEYKIQPNNYQMDLAHSFIDAGADVVIGSHPHVIQEKEIYKGKHIYYSLGNFVFDQYFEDQVRCGGLIVLKISPKDFEYKVQEFFTHLEKNGQTTLSSCSDEVPYLSV